MKTITVYYKFDIPSDNRAYLKITQFASLYSDEKCTQKIGYYGVTKDVNPYSSTIFISQVNIGMFFNDNIVEYNYVVVETSEITTPITYYNKWNGNGTIGKVNRKILSDNKTRKVTITINESQI